MNLSSAVHYLQINAVSLRVRILNPIFLKNFIEVKGVLQNP